MSSKSDSEILSAYPLYMTKEQMYQVCHISKRTCLYLLEAGLVPCLDSGKKTRRFRIKTTDVLHYLKDRDIHPERYKPPEGFYKHLYTTAPSPRNFTEKDIRKMRSFYTEALTEWPDVLSSKQVSEFTGYCTTSVNNWCTKEKLKHFFIKHKFYIPKKCLIDFLVSWDYIGIGVKSLNHRIMDKQLRAYLRSHN